MASAAMSPTRVCDATNDLQGVVESPGLRQYQGDLDPAFGRTDRLSGGRDSPVEAAQPCIRHGYRVGGSDHDTRREGLRRFLCGVEHTRAGGPYAAGRVQRCRRSRPRAERDDQDRRRRREAQGTSDTHGILAPTPRPDFALFHGNTLHGFLDAKYRDTWTRGLPAEWLYQLSIYALSSPARTSLMLYASTSSEACDEKVEIRDPLWRSADASASVVVRPVPLLRLAELVTPERKSSLATERRRWAEQLVTMKHRLPAGA